MCVASNETSCKTGFPTSQSHVHGTLNGKGGLLSVCENLERTTHTAALTWVSVCVRLCVHASGYWNTTVYGRKHSYRLYTKMLNEAMRWASAVQGVIDNKVPIETPTQQLIRDIKVQQQPVRLHKGGLSICGSIIGFHPTGLNRS